MRKSLMLAGMFLVLTACNGVAKDFVTGVDPSNGRAPASPPIVAPTLPPNNGPSSFKTSPGNISNTGSSLAMHATITPTDHVVKSATMSAKLSIQRQRTTP